MDTARPFLVKSRASEALRPGPVPTISAERYWGFCIGSPRCRGFDAGIGLSAIGKETTMDQAQPVGRIDVISDAICPWCYIGKRHLERALDLLETQHLKFSVAWHPFQLNPDIPREGVDR